jgi:1-acyl-sn-glycerol-3-phosphate acyltransferase
MHLFYRRFHSVKFDESINEGSIIIAPNHQNAFMDALAIVMTQPRVSYYLTQAKVFQSKLGNAFFTYIFMLPIYRERDGMNTIIKNKEIITKCIDIVEEGKQPLTIFPEGNHNLRRGLRPLKKGIARIAFGVLDKNPDSDLRIVPVGINYSSHKKFRSDLFVNYGEPFAVKPFYKLYLENNNQGYIALLEELEKRMHTLIIDMPRGLRYHKIAKSWVKNANGTFDSEYNFKKNQALLEAIINEQPLPEKEVSDTPKFLKILFSPFWLFMFINNFIAFKIVHVITKKLAEDPAFVSSMKLVFGIFLSVFIYLAQAGIVMAFTSFWIGLIYFLSIPLLNFILFKIYQNSFEVK